MKHRMAFGQRSKVSWKIQEQTLRLKSCKDHTHTLDPMALSTQSDILLTRTDIVQKELTFLHHPPHLHLLLQLWDLSLLDQSHHVSISKNKKKISQNLFNIFVINHRFTLPLKKQTYVMLKNNSLRKNTFFQTTLAFILYPPAKHDDITWKRLFHHVYLSLFYSVCLNY